MSEEPKLGLTGRWRHRERAWKVGGLFRSRVVMCIAVEVEEARWRDFYPSATPPRGATPKEGDLQMVWRLATLSEAADLDPSKQVRA